MQDMIPKGTGNSRFLKSAIPADITHEQLVALFRSGQFPVDFAGLNPEGIATQGTPLNKANLLSGTTADSLLPDTSEQTVNAAIALLSQRTRLSQYALQCDLVFLEFKNSAEWVAPYDAVNDEVNVFMIGGGGGGGGSEAGNSSSTTGSNITKYNVCCGGGGGGGNIAIKYNVPIVPGNVYELVIGSGGSGSNGKTVSALATVTHAAPGDNGGDTQAFGIVAAGGTGGEAGYLKDVESSHGGAGGDGGTGGGGGSCHPYDILFYRSGKGGNGSFGGGGGGATGGWAGNINSPHLRVGCDGADGGTGGLYGGGGGGAGASAKGNRPQTVAVPGKGAKGGAPLMGTGGDAATINAVVLENSAPGTDGIMQDIALFISEHITLPTQVPKAGTGGAGGIINTSVPASGGGGGGGGAGGIGGKGAEGMLTGGGGGGGGGGYCSNGGNGNQSTYNQSGGGGGGGGGGLFSNGANGTAGGGGGGGYLTHGVGGNGGAHNNDGNALAGTAGTAGYIIIWYYKKNLEGT